MVNTTPWLVLNLNAIPPATTQEGTTSIIASLQTDSNGITHDPLTEGHAPNGITSTFTSDTLGSVDPTSTTLMGAATALFTAGTTLGNSVVTATIDSQTVNKLVDIVIGSVINNRTGITYGTIQSAIDDIETISGDTLIVSPGTTGIYIENVIVSKMLSIIANGTVTVQALDADLPVFDIQFGADGSIINGFNIIGSNNCGVQVGASNVTIINNTIDGASSGNGIVFYAPGTNIINNYINNTFEAIFASLADNSSITGNQINNAFYAIMIFDGTGYNILNNIINQTLSDAISISGTYYFDPDTSFTYSTPVTDSIISGNIINGGNNGIYLYNGINNSITNNIIINCAYDGVLLSLANGTQVIGNFINGFNGIELFDTLNDTIQFNIILADNYGINNGNIDSITAENNYWGLNTDVDTKISGLVDYNPYLILILNATPTIIPLNGTSNITADLTWNSDNVQPAGGHIPDNIPIEFTTTLGNVTSPALTNNGVAQTKLNGEQFLELQI